ncbi:MAG TPA: hypothetical protein DIC60_03700 [Lachnospiraceae bacterium]|nr:hypothetical protein [Lachnospiraceae bacterium]
MEILFLNRFKKEFKNLSMEEKKAFEAKMRLMSENPYHPSLRIKKIQGKESIFECSITMAIRMTWEYINDNIYLRVIGEHDYTLKNP